MLKILIKITFFTVVLFSDNLCLADNIPETIKIIPEPVSIKTLRGSFVLSMNKPIPIIHDSITQNLAFHIQEEIKNSLGLKLPVLIKSTEDKHDKAISLKYSSIIPEEGYNINVTKTLIEIEGGSLSGIFYGFQTLKQLMPIDVFMRHKCPEKLDIRIPCVSISDYPHFKWRGFMLDVSRHFHSKEFILDVLDQMASIKLNKLHWHLSDDQGWRIEIKKYPKLTEIGSWRVNRNHISWWGRKLQQPGEIPDYGGYYTQEDIKEIVNYAKKLYIEIIPEIDMPGHAQSIVASYPELGCVGVQPNIPPGGIVKRYNTINPGKEETYEFVENIINELVELFPSKYIHIGGDECNKEQWEIDPYCQQKLKELGTTDVKRLQSYFIKRVEKIVNAKSKNLIGWDEILEGGLAPNATVMSWRGEKGGIHAAKKGHDVIMTPMKYCYLDLRQGPPDSEPPMGYSLLSLKTCYSYDPMPNVLSDAEAKHILGIQGNLWTESIQNPDQAFYMMYPRLFAIAENGWTQQTNKDWNSFINRLHPRLQYLDLRDIKYAVSAFNVNFLVKKSFSGNIDIALKTEVDNAEIFYTLDGKEPSVNSILYSGKFINIDSTTTIKAKAYSNKKSLGKTIEKTIHIHKAANTKINFKGGIHKSDPETDKLTDMLVADFSRRNKNWMKSYGRSEYEINFNKETEVSEVRLNFFHFPYQRIYIPKEVSVWGSNKDDEFKRLASYSFKEEFESNCKDFISKKIKFPPTQVQKLKVIINTPVKAPKNHFREGDHIHSLLDEIIVL